MTGSKDFDNRPGPVRDWECEIPKQFDVISKFLELMNAAKYKMLTNIENNVNNAEITKWRIRFKREYHKHGSRKKKYET